MYPISFLQPVGFVGWETRRRFLDLCKKIIKDKTVLKT
ncbi:hypothetical protein ADIS_4612 [Lunatimonas lonarensis]|uniref:Uncharacterized protein n=1 Tax=Lunatimonas lonarensis TaxID=1232681 RepID=R7ZLF5_9BACT|nr:hypothetical protein ADIS_4612 [Lunatimonas lonarensis]